MIHSSVQLYEWGETKCLVLQPNFFFLWLYSPCGPWPLFQFPNLYTVGRTPWRGESAHRKAATYTQNNTNTNKRAQTSMPLAGFEPTIPALERAMTVHALDCVATVISAAAAGSSASSPDDR
jgi:hypothetical protein